MTFSNPIYCMTIVIFWSKFVPKGSINEKDIIDLHNGLVRQAIIWTNDGLAYGRLYR